MRRTHVVDAYLSQAWSAKACLRFCFESTVDDAAAALVDH